MTLSPEACLRGVLDMLQNRITPALSDRYAAETARLAGLVLTITTNGIDDAAAIRIAENDAMRAMFREAAAVIGDAGMAEKLDLAAQSKGSGFKISQLDRDNGELRALLVDLHAMVEDLHGGEFRGLESRIWQMLREFEVARAPRR